jgi:hypothetical protein
MAVHGTPMRRGEYGFDAPYAVVIFGAVAVASAVGATICWREGETRVAARMTLFSVFFLFNTVSFLYDQAGQVRRMGAHTGSSSAARR